MSGWSGIVVGGIVIALALVAVGQPVWEWRYNQAGGIETWSYGLFGVDHTSTNASANTSSSYNYTYETLPSQPKMAAVFQEAQLWFLLALVAAIAGTGLSVANVLRKLKGLYAGVALLAACGAILFAALNLILTIPPATADLPNVVGQSISNFQGQYVAQGSNVSVGWGPVLGWYLLLGIGLAAGWGASDMWSMPLVKPAPAIAKPVVKKESLPPPPPVELTPVPPEPVIEEVFVIASSGLLIKHMSRSLMTDKDRDVVGGMISVVSNFVREAFSERDGQVQEVTLGDHRFIICNERRLVVAALVSRGETEDVVHRLRHLLACLFDRYGNRLEDWQGEAMEGIEDEISVLWEPFFAPPPPAD